MKPERYNPDLPGEVQPLYQLLENTDIVEAGDLFCFRFAAGYWYKHYPNRALYGKTVEYALDYMKNNSQMGPTYFIRPMK